MKLADMKLMLKLAGWRLRSKTDGYCRSYYIQDDKGALRSHYYESQYDAAEWGILMLTGNEEDFRRYKQRKQDLLRAKLYENINWRKQHEGNN